MKKFFWSLLCGILFGIGLSLSQMVNPEKIINFLDITGSNFDMSLLLVIIAAQLTTFGLYAFILKWKTPICDTEFHLPSKQRIDRPLIYGAILFGIGWGLTGLCPGPAWAGLVYGKLESIVFLSCFYLGGFLVVLSGQLHEVKSGQ